jgi:chromatin structure-remodeling complex subunit RSC3/30
MAGAYSMDKQLATFLGRPPQISWRYCDVQLPLDLGYNEILADLHTREAAINRPDANGWNTGEVIQKAQWMRVALVMGRIREQILELSLSDCVDDLPQRAKWVPRRRFCGVAQSLIEARQISENSRRTWDGLPSFLRWHPNSGNSDDSGSLLIPLYLDFLYNDFLLYRLLLRRSQDGSDALINVSQTILGAVLELIGKEIASGPGTYNVGWNVSPTFSRARCL